MFHTDVFHTDVFHTDMFHTDDCPCSIQMCCIQMGDDERAQRMVIPSQMSGGDGGALTMSTSTMMQDFKNFRQEVLRFAFCCPRQ